MKPIDEFAVKRQRLTGVMEAENLDALLIRRHDNFAWLSCGGNSNVVVTSDAGVGSLLLTRDGKNLLVTNNIEAARLMEEEGLGELGFSVLDYPWDRDGEAAAVEKAAGSLSRLGCDTPFGAAREVFAAILPHRRELTANERERYLFLGKKLSVAVETVMYGLRPGDGEGDAAGKIAAELWKDRIDVINALVAFDDRIGKYRHPVTVNRQLRRKAMLSINARYKGLVATVTRLGHIGGIPSDLADQYRDNVEIECRMIAATTPGTPDTVPLRVAVDAYAEFGHPGEERLHHQGGSMGYQARDSIATPSSTGAAGVNQAYCWNPTIAGTKSEDGFIVEESGPLFITGPVCFPTLTIDVGGQTFVRPGLLEI